MGGTLVPKIGGKIAGFATKGSGFGLRQRAVFELRGVPFGGSFWSNFGINFGPRFGDQFLGRLIRTSIAVPKIGYQK